MNFLEAIILGVVEGFTEFLPISSTAHLILTSQVLRIPESAFLSSFIIAIQLGAIASVVLIFWRRVFLNFCVMKRVSVAFIPTALIGYALYSLVKGFLFDSLEIIAWTLLLGGIILIIFEYWRKDRTIVETPLSEMPYMTAFVIGCIQAIAIIPGVSRAGATIVGGMLLGLGRKEIVEFSFLLAIPTMLAATGYDLLKTGSSFAAHEWELLAVGFLVSFIAAYAGIRFLMRLVQTHSFTGFGWYRVVLGVAVLAYLYVA
ncbi:undecaprenyl-diphosphatase UppP [bacterium]|nr:undecaprenyl-diphosphatase UppP [bacterium]